MTFSIAFVGLVLVVVTAWLVSHRVPGYREPAAMFTYFLVVDILRAPIVRGAELGIPPGWLNGLNVVGRFLVVGWWFAPLALAVHVFLDRRPWPVLAAWIVAWLPLVDVARFQGRTHEAVLHAYALGALVASWLVVAWGIVRRGGPRPGPAHLAVMLWLATDLAIDVVPLAHAFEEHWKFVRVANLVLYAALVALHVGTLWRSARAPAPP